MSSLNHVYLIGRLGRNPESKELPNGKGLVCNFSMATSDKTKEGTDLTEWHNIVSFGNVAETAARYLTKGRLVFVEGKLTTRRWEGKDGQKHTRTEINAKSIKFLDTNKQEAEAQQVEQTHPQPYPDELPI